MQYLLSSTSFRRANSLQYDPQDPWDAAVAAAEASKRQKQQQQQQQRQQQRQSQRIGGSFSHLFGGSSKEEDDDYRDAATKLRLDCNGYRPPSGGVVRGRSMRGGFSTEEEDEAAFYGGGGGDASMAAYDRLREELDRRKFLEDDDGECKTCQELDQSTFKLVINVYFVGTRTYLGVSIKN